SKWWLCWVFALLRHHYTCHCLPHTPKLLQQSSCCRLIGSGLRHHHAHAAVVELVVRQLHVHHLVATHAALLDHDGGAEHVEHEFLGSACLHAGAACHKLRSYHYLYRVLCFGRHRT